jgi:hypothetical protein
LASLRLNREGFFQQREQMNLTLVSIIILAAMIFILSGMVGYLYWQQTRLMQSVQSITLALTSHLTPQPVHVELEAEAEAEEEDVQEAEIAEDDRVSVEETIEHVDAPRTSETQEDDIDDLQTKTVKQLKELLTKKGIPFNKSDSKTTLLEILKATA